MRLRPDPLHLALGSLSIGLAVFLAGVAVAWRSSTDPARTLTLGGATEAAPSPVEPDFEAPVADAPWTIAPQAVPAPTAPPSTAPAPAPAAPEPATIAPAAPSTAEAPPTPPGPDPMAAIKPFIGMGTWVDVFDWAPSYAKGKPVKLQPAAVDDMADQGVQVLYIQTTRADYTGQGDIVDPTVLRRWLDRADARGMQVVAWYLPTLTDVKADLRRLKATAAIASVDGIGVDIESKAVADHDERSSRLVELSRLTRSALAGRPLSAITLPNVVTDVINLDYWPRFPWAQIKPYYDAWQPMGYWTNRRADSPYRNAELYTRENVDRLRTKLGDPTAVVHPIGGIGDKTTPTDVALFLKAARETGSVGASLYDWGTQSLASYKPMRAARA